MTNNKPKLNIDLNLDAGENPESLDNGSEEELYKLVTSVNIACGGHSGDERTMKKAIHLAQKHKLNIGAHPSFADKKNFGRIIIPFSVNELKNSLLEQIQFLKIQCDLVGAKLSHVKPHGALYNLAAENTEAADAIIQAVLQLTEKTPIVALAGSSFVKKIKEAGLHVIEEAFCDRLYEESGTLRNRHYSDAVYTDPAKAATQAKEIVFNSRVTTLTGKKINLMAQTLCIHGDSPNALKIATAVRDALI